MGTLPFLLTVTYFDFLRTYFDTRLSMSSFTPSNTEEGPKAPRRARRALGAQRAPSPPQELEGWARSAQIFYLKYIQNDQNIYY